MRLSVVIPVYNLARRVRVALESLLRQEDQQFEVIVVDDGSEDDSASIVREFIDQNGLSRWTLIEKTNGGVSSARNVGLLAATGDYVLFLDADDYVSDKLVHILNSILERDSPDVVYWGYDRVTEDGVLLESYPYMTAAVGLIMSGAETLLHLVTDRRASLWTGSIAYRRQLLVKEGIGYTEGCVCGEDVEFTYKVLSRASTVLFVPRVLSYYVQRSDSRVHTYSVRLFDAVEATERACRYLRSLNDRHILRIADIVETSNLVDRFIWCYRRSLDLLVAQGVSPSKAVKIVESDLEKSYPSLKSRVITVMARSYSGPLSHRVRAASFHISPLLYYYLTRLKSLGRWAITLVSRKVGISLI